MVMADTMELAAPDYFHAAAAARYQAIAKAMNLKPV
jgi:hypothetical protein